MLSWSYSSFADNSVDICVCQQAGMYLLTASSCQHVLVPFRLFSQLPLNANRGQPWRQVISGASSCSIKSSYVPTVAILQTGFIVSINVISLSVSIFINAHHYHWSRSVNSQSRHFIKVVHLRCMKNKACLLNPTTSSWRVSLLLRWWVTSRCKKRGRVAPTRPASIRSAEETGLSIVFGNNVGEHLLCAHI
jgi:hypothetical protein